MEAGAELGSAHGEPDTCDPASEAFWKGLSFQRAAGIMRLNLADCDFDFSNDFWPREFFVAFVFS